MRHLWREGALNLVEAPFSVLRDPEDMRQFSSPHTWQLIDFF